LRAPRKRDRDAALAGSIFTKAREAGLLPITRATPAQTIQGLFGVGPEEFWKAVAKLEGAREVRTTAAGIEYVEPADRS
jgi:hypothetical protein